MSIEVSNNALTQQKGVMNRKPYPSDLSDEEWQILKPLIPLEKPGGKHRNVNMREIANAIFYLVRNGCTWRALPHDFPPWQTVSTYFYSWQRLGVWEQINRKLRSQVRLTENRNPEPRAGIIDSQSVKTTEKGGTVATMLVKRSKVASDTSW